MSKTNLISIEKIEKAIYLIRGEKVMLDRDLAELYEVQTKALNQAVRRNSDRFPWDFMFQLSEKEVVELNRSQFVTGYQKHRDPRSRPYAFTEHGVAMLSSVLRSKRAITVNIEIVRAFEPITDCDRVLWLRSHSGRQYRISKIHPTLPRFGTDHIQAPFLVPDGRLRLNRSQNVIGSEKHRDPRLLPYPFSQQRKAFKITICDLKEPPTC